MVTVSSSHTVPSLQQAMGGNSSTDSFPRISGNNGVLQVSQNILLCQWESIDNPYISVAIPSGIQLPIITYQHTDHDIILSMNIHEQQSCHPHPKAAFGEVKKFCFECKNLNPQYTQLLLLAFFRYCIKCNTTVTNTWALSPSQSSRTILFSCSMYLM